VDNSVGCSVLVVTAKLGRNSKEGNSMVDGDSEDEYEYSEWGGGVGI
jgi:hypothetical protein